MPKFLRYTIILSLYIFIIQLAYRGIFNSFYLKDCSFEQKLSSFILGARFDMRLSLIICALPCAASMFFFKNKYFYYITPYYIAVCVCILTTFLIGDIGYFAYTGERLNASIVSFLENPDISLKMIYQTYPLGLFIISEVVLFILNIIFGFFIYKISNKGKDTKSNKITLIGSRVLTFILFSWGIYSSVGPYPLRWSAVFFSENRKLNISALNPVLYFYDSFKFSDLRFEKEEFDKYYKTIAKHLQVVDNPKDKFARIFKSDEQKSQMNIVIVMCESLGASAMGYYGNLVNATPKIDSLVKNSIFFENCFVPRAQTAFSMYGCVTGIPDVTDKSTASRNPMAINQRVIMNQAKDYKKLYMIGGSASWANIRAIFQNNVHQIEMIEQEKLPQEFKRVDVWGVNDYDLFFYADKVLDSLNKKNEHFVTFIQSASNHRPYTVPDSLDGFKPLKENELLEELIKESGMLSLAQINALRFFDFNINKFLERAKKSGYAKNTLFLFFGDHSLSMTTTKHMPRPLDNLGLSTYQIPMFIWSENIEPKTISKQVSMLDAFPTLFETANISHTNYTLGRNAIKTPEENQTQFLYTQLNGKPAAAVLNDSLIFLTTTKAPFEKVLYRFKKGEPLKQIELTENFLYLDSLALGYYHSAKYLYFNNNK